MSIVNKKRNTFLKTLISCNFHYGGHPKKTNNLNNTYIYGIRDDIHIWDLEKTIPIYRQTLFIIKEIYKNKGTILFIGAPKNNIVNNILKKIAKKTNNPFLSSKWIGGTFTNWHIIKKNMQNLNTKSKNKLIKQKRFIDLIMLEKKPDLLVIGDSIPNKNVIKEAFKMNIPVIGFIDTNTNVKGITYPIYGNNKSPINLTLYSKILEKILI